MRPMRPQTRTERTIWTPADASTPRVQGQDPCGCVGGEGGVEGPVAQKNPHSGVSLHVGPSIAKTRYEVRHTKETFGAFWSRWLDRRKPYLEEGTWGAYERDGRLRLMPALGSVPLGRLDVEHVRELMDQWTEAMEAEELAPKTINNTLGTLVVCLNAAVEDGLMATNPALRVPRLPPAHIEREYLRLHEIPL